MRASRLKEDRGQFRKGRAETGDAARAPPNRATRAVKEFLSEILNDPTVQDAMRARVLAGDTSAFFKALEIIHGRPRQALEVKQDARVVYSWEGEN